MILKGIAASPGIAIGRAYTITTESPTVDREVIAPADVAQEVERFHAAHQVTLLQLQGDGSQRPFVVMVSQCGWLTPVHGNKGFFSIDTVGNARHQGIAAAGIEH